ncbi:putative disease resistance protein rga3, partial [Phtheirospermum japonicum]
KSLRTLTLVGKKDIDGLPTSIKEHKHLKYLDISNTRIKYLSDSIGELYHLQKLRAEMRYLKQLPNTLSYLINLRHHHIYKDTMLPPEIGKLNSLRTLSYFHVGGEKGYGILDLGSLKKLKGKLEIRKLEQMRDKNEGDGANDESVLEGLQPHPDLKGLEIFGFKGKRLPLWEGLNNLMKIKLTYEGLNNLMKIKLTYFSGCEELPMLGHLPSLKSLCLDGLTNVRSIPSSFYGNIDSCRRDTIVYCVSCV